MKSFYLIEKGETVIRKDQGKAQPVILTVFAKGTRVCCQVFLESRRHQMVPFYLSEEDDAAFKPQGILDDVPDTVFANGTRFRCQVYPCEVGAGKINRCTHTPLLELGFGAWRRNEQH